MSSRDEHLLVRYHCLDPLITMEVSRRPVGRPRLRQTSSLFRVKFRGDALLWLIFGIDSWCKSREFSNHPLETHILRRTFMQNRKKLWRPLRSPVALRRLGNPPIPTGGLLTRLLDPPIVRRGQKRWKRMSKCPSWVLFGHLGTVLTMHKTWMRFWVRDGV